MPRLVLIRHAKSSWTDPNLTDFERPLNQRGLRDAPEMGQRLACNGFSPSLVLVSTAVRAQETAAHLLTAAGVDEHKVMTDPALYGATLGDLLAIVNALDDKDACVAVVGHNPGMSYLAGYLSQTPIGELPTAAVVTLDFDCRWSEVLERTGTLIDFDFPKKTQL